MCCCASRRGFIASPCRRCASRNSSANVCFCEGRSQKSTNRHPATPASLNSNTPPTNWNFDMLDFPRTALREGGDPYAVPERCVAAYEMRRGQGLWVPAFAGTTVRGASAHSSSPKQLAHDLDPTWNAVVDLVRLHERGLEAAVLRAQSWLHRRHAWHRGQIVGLLQHALAVFRG